MVFDRKAHWQNIYKQKTPGEVSWYQKEPMLSMELIHATGIRKDEAIIDVGGGTSRLVDFLCKAGFTNLAMLDISDHALTSAKKRLGILASSIAWFEADVTEFTPPHLFSLWHDRAVFHFLTDRCDRMKYIRTLTTSLRSGGHLIMAAFAIGGPTKCSGLEIVQYDAEKLMSELGKEFELLEERNEAHITPSGMKQMFTYFRLIRKSPHYQEHP